VTASRAAPSEVVAGRERVGAAELAIASEAPSPFTEEREEAHVLVADLKDRVPTSCRLGHGFTVAAFAQLPRNTVEPKGTLALRSHDGRRKGDSMTRKKAQQPLATRARRLVLPAATAAILASTLAAFTQEIIPRCFDRNASCQGGSRAGEASST
jgi:hypothetical protein